jgi:plastocyanin
MVEVPAYNACMRPHRRVGLTTIALLGCLAGPAPAADTGTVTGVVRFTGPVPPPREIVTTDNRTLRHHDLVVDPGTRGLRDVVAVLEDAPAQPKVADAEPVVIDQRDMLFVPRVVVVRHGQAVRFDNSDQFNHSVLTATPVAEDQLNVFVTPGRPLDHTFALRKHPVRIGCSLHPWMRAWVYVVAHPWFAITDERGRFRIRDIPPGRYTLWLRHPDTGRQDRRPVEVRAGGKLEVTVTWPKAGEGPANAEGQTRPAGQARSNDER